MSLLISVLVLLVVAYVIFLALQWIFGVAHLPAPIVTIAWIIFGAIVIIKLLGILGYSTTLLK